MRIWGFAAAVLTCVSVFAADAPPQESAAQQVGGILQSIFGRHPATNAQPAATNIISKPAETSAGTNLLSTNLPSSTAQAGLKEALQAAFTNAIAMLGRTNGFLTNKEVRIPLPPQLNWVEQGLRRIHEDALVDEFDATMNHAAEKAVPAAADVLLKSVEEMPVQDALTLVTSKSQTAITDYFQKAASTNLFDKLLPIVQEATANSGVTAAYKNLMQKLPSSLSFLSHSESLNLDHYVTSKTLDGLFQVAGEEEKRIRENPQARTTELLQKVFGAVVGAAK